MLLQIKKKLKAACAGWLQCKTETMSGKSKILLLLVFCLLSCGYSIYLIIASLSAKQEASFSIASVETPKHIRRSGDEAIKASILISKQEYLRIHRFKQYMDSLAGSSSGVKLYDSIITQRPHLMDSILFIEQVYQTQTKK